MLSPLQPTFTPSLMWPKLQTVLSLCWSLQLAGTVMEIIVCHVYLRRDCRAMVGKFTVIQGITYYAVAVIKSVMSEALPF